MTTSQQQPQNLGPYGGLYFDKRYFVDMSLDICGVEIFRKKYWKETIYVT